jgi:hypothetical protein
VPDLSDGRSAPVASVIWKRRTLEFRSHWAQRAWRIRIPNVEGGTIIAARRGEKVPPAGQIFATIDRDHDGAQGGRDTSRRTSRFENLRHELTTAMTF